MNPFTPLRITACALATLAAPAMAQEVNVYSSRHYDSDDALYAEFTNQTGIKVNRIEAKADELIARMVAEGDNSPADVFVAVDVGRMTRAEEAGILQPYNSAMIESRIPDHMQHPDNLWFGITQRARIIFYSKDRVAHPPQTYEELADAKWKGAVCIRSSSNVYNQSLLASLIESNGEAEAEAWAAGVVANMARAPQGGDTDQLRGIVSGECDVAVANHYYFLRGFNKDVDGLTSGIEGIGWVWPNQDGRGAHLNLNTASMAAHSPNPDEAKSLLEFFAGDFAQTEFARQNNEFTTVSDGVDDESTARLGEFKADTSTNMSSFSRNSAAAQAIFNKVGWD